MTHDTLDVYNRLGIGFTDDSLLHGELSTDQALEVLDWVGSFSLPSKVRTPLA